MNIENIISLGRKFACSRSKLSAVVDRIRRAQQAALDENRLALRDAVKRANTDQAELASAISGAPELFAKPRTVVVDGVRLGMTTRKGGIAFDDAEAVVMALERKFPSLADAVIRTKKAPDKDALANWTDGDLAKVFCRRLTG
jgi:hypothetical protein